MDSTALRTLLEQWRPRLAALDEAASREVVGSRWNRKEILGHLLDSGSNNQQRFVRLQQGDLEGFPGYDGDFWVAAGQYRQAAWSDLVTLWFLTNQQLARVIDGIEPASEGHVWQNGAMDLKALVEDYSRHMLHHLQALRLA